MAATNFQYVKSFPLTSGSLYTVALDALGTLWSENVAAAPFVLASLVPTVLPGSYMQSTTQDDVEYMCFSDLVQGTDIPRQYNPQPAIGGYTLDRISQVGPGAPPVFQPTTTVTATQAAITSWAGVGGTVTFQAVNTFTAGEVVTLSGFAVSTFFNGLQFSVLGTGLSGTQFEVAFSGYSGGSDSGVATPQYGYPIFRISQLGSVSFNGQIALWSAGPGQTSTGTTITLYYGSKNTAADANLTNAFNSGQAVYVYISGAPFGNGTQLVTGIGAGAPPGEDPLVNYLTVQAPSSSFQKIGGPSTTGNTGTYQMTVATLVTSLPIPNVGAGDELTITGATPSGWNNTWTIVNALNSGVYAIVQTSMALGNATYTWQWAGTSTAVAPTSGQLVTVIQTLNGNGVFNVTDAVIATVTGGPSSGTFTINNLGSASQNVAAAAEQGQAETSGTSFQFDPGAITLGTTTSPIYGPDTATGIVSVAGSNTSIAPGTRQAVVFFETRNGLKTACSIPVTFTTDVAATYLLADQVPIGPPDVIRRWIAFTTAGPNGIAGPNFYTIDNPVSFTVNNQTFLYSATKIDDNITTSAKFTFTDAVLLAGEEIDVLGNNLFAEIELGSSAWSIAYAQRMFYGLEQNKVLNFTNLSFDGGYLPNPGGNLVPLGWGVDVTSNQSPATGSPITAFQIFLVGGGTVTTAALSPSTASGSGWASASRIESNGLYSTITLTHNATSGLLQGGAFMAPIPSDATILGIQAHVTRTNVGGGLVRDSVVQLLKAGVLVGSNKASASGWGVDETISYGGSSDLWGTTWSPTDSIGLGVSAKNSDVDTFQIGLKAYTLTITYQTPDSNFVTFQCVNTFVAGTMVTISGLTTGTYLNGQTLTVLPDGLSGTQFEANFSHAATGLIVDAGVATPSTSSGGAPAAAGTLVVSPVFGNAYYVSNQTGSTQASYAMIIQNAQQDGYNVPIILPNTLYSVRVTASIPSGNTTGSLIVDLTGANAGVGSASGTGSITSPYGITYGTFTLPFANMSQSVAIYTGTLLTTPFTTGVPTGLLLRHWAQNIGNGADMLVDRIEVFPTSAPLLATNIRVSYVDNFEAFDAVTGNLGLASHNTQPAYGAFVMHDQLYFLQSASMQSTQDVPGIEPSNPGGGWALHEVSNRVGACGIHAYDYGEEWALMACRNGIYGFNGGQPIRIDFQQRELWEMINWEAGRTIWLRNDLPNSRILVGVPLPTPNQWLPLAPSNPTPTTPNVILMWNYQNLNTFEEIVNGRGVHTTMFGTLAAVDMRLKASIWQIPSPYGGFITQPDGITSTLTLCNGNGSGKLYQLSADQLSDDGVAINGKYFTFGFVDAAKAKENPLLGLHRKRFQMVQQLINGVGVATVEVYPNYILNPKTLAFNPSVYTVPGGITLQEAPPDDILRPLNSAGNRVYLAYSTNAVGAAFHLSKAILVGTIDNFTSVNPNSG